MNGYSFIFGLVLLAALAGLIVAAAYGSMVAAVVLAVIATVMLLSISALFLLAWQRMTIKAQQADFLNNAKENLMLLQQQQKIQNLQNSTIMEQLRTVARLPEPNGNAAGLIVDYSVLEGLNDDDGF